MAPSLLYARVSVCHIGRIQANFAKLAKEGESIGRAKHEHGRAASTGRHPSAAGQGQKWCDGKGSPGKLRLLDGEVSCNT